MSEVPLHDPFNKRELASRNSFEGLVWCNFGHVTVEMSSQRNPRTPPSGCAPEASGERAAHTGVPRSYETAIP